MYASEYVSETRETVQFAADKFPYECGYLHTRLHKGRLAYELLRDATNYQFLFKLCHAVARCWLSEGGRFDDALVDKYSAGSEHLVIRNGLPWEYMESLLDLRAKSMSEPDVPQRLAEALQRETGLGVERQYEIGVALDSGSDLTTIRSVIGSLLRVRH